MPLVECKITAFTLGQLLFGDGAAWFSHGRERLEGTLCYGFMTVTGGKQED